MQVVGATELHRIGGSTVENLRLKAREATLDPAGISVLEASSPAEAARQIRAAFPQARSLHQAARTIGSTRADQIRGAGFDVIHVPTRSLPNHCRLVHPDGAAGFTDKNLARLASVFVDTTGH